MKAFTSLALAGAVVAHYTFPFTTYGGTEDSEYQHIRMTDNHYSQDPVTDVTSFNIRCYDSQKLQAASVLTVKAGSTITITADGTIYHPGVVNVYMARAPDGTDVTTWDPTDAVWFKTFQLTGSSNTQTGFTWPSTTSTTVSNIPIPAALPSGYYLLRLEQIGLHVAYDVGGAQFYIGCVQLQVTGGGNGVPGPLVAFPGAYTGNEPGLYINIYGPPYPSTYIQPGPPVWTGGVAASTSGGTVPTTTPSSPTTSPHSTTSPTTSPHSTTVPTTTPHTTTTPSTACAAKYAQCGGSGWTGATCCVSSTCTVSNAYYSQCL